MVFHGAKIPIKDRFERGSKFIMDDFNFIGETANIDDCVCVYCGHKFDGQIAINNDLDTSIVECPKCNKEMKVLLSVEYTCQRLD